MLTALDDDGIWRTPDGVPTSRLVLGSSTIVAHVDPHQVRAASRDADQGWLRGALADLRELATRHVEFTSDDLGAVLSRPPRGSRQRGALMNAGSRAGCIAPTDGHEPSRRDLNDRRQCASGSRCRPTARTPAMGESIQGRESDESYGRYRAASGDTRVHGAMHTHPLILHTCEDGHAWRSAAERRVGLLAVLTRPGAA